MPVSGSFHGLRPMMDASGRTHPAIPPRAPPLVHPRNGYILPNPQVPASTPRPVSKTQRRKRCGVCGPCKIQTNCNACKNCIKRKVLKQTCIYRKCVHLREKVVPDAAKTFRSPPRDFFRPEEDFPKLIPKGTGCCSPDDDDIL